MAGFVTIPCPQCHTLNRVPAQRRGEDAKCGRCHQPLFTGKPTDLDTAHFDRHANAADLPLLVDFWADWCVPCRAMAPAFAGAAKAFETRIRFAKVDTDAEPSLAERYRIQAIPTMILFRGGRELVRHSGTMPAGALRAWIEQHVKA